MKTMRFSLLLFTVLLLSAAVTISACKKDKEDEMTDENSSGNNDNDTDEEKGKGTISVVVRRGYCNDYVGELYVKVNGEQKGTLGNCNDDIACGATDAAALNIEVEEGQHSVEVSSESYSGSYNVSVGKDECKLIEIY